MLSKKRGFSIAMIIVVAGLFFFAASALATEQNFRVNTVLLKVAVHGGESLTKAITVSSVLGGNFSAEVKGVQGVTLSPERFTLQRDGGKDIMLRFNSSGIVQGVHAGSVVITSGGDVSRIPLIFEVESQDSFYDLNLEIPPEYTEVVPGKKVVAYVKIFDLTSGGVTTGLGSNPINVEYTTSNLEGEVISSEKEDLVVDRQTQLTKTLAFPSTIRPGIYVFSAIVKYRSSVGTSSALFTVAEPEQPVSLQPEKGFDTSVLFAIFIVILFVVLTIVFVYLIRDRDKFLVELKGYNALELKRQHAFLLAQQQLLLKKKALSMREAQREIKQKVRRLKARHQERVQHLKILKKEGNVDEMQRKLNEWKKEGYRTTMLENKMNALGNKDMQRLLETWKKKYRTY